MKKTIILFFAFAMGLQFVAAQTTYNITWRVSPNRCGRITDMSDYADVTGLTVSKPQGSTSTYAIEVLGYNDLYELTVDGVNVDFNNDTNFAIAQGYYTYTVANLQHDVVCVAHLYPGTPPDDAVNEVSTSKIAIYPNPAVSFATLTIEGANGEVDYSFIDLSGRIVRHKTVNAASAERIDLSGLANGTYFVRVTNESFSKVEKLVVSGQ